MRLASLRGVFYLRRLATKQSQALRVQSLMRSLPVRGLLRPQHQVRGPRNDAKALP